MEFQETGVRIKYALWALLGGALSGCSLIPADTFTLQTDMPPNFQLKADAYYVPATGEACTVPPRKRGYVPDRKIFTSEPQSSAHTAVFNIPLTARVGDCPLVLKSVKLDVEGRWGPNKFNLDSDYASLSFRDGTSNLKPQVFNGECKWLFRTMGPYRYIVKILQCRAVDGQGKVVERLAGGILRRDSLAGKTVKLAFKVAIEEEPYYDDAWLKTPKGWKPCTGRWGTNNEEYCTTPPQFTDFKMPDGRSCTAYPNCSE